MLRYPHLLSPIKIGDSVIKNRMMSPYCLPKYMQGPETYPTDHYHAFFANFARNGAGIVVVSEWDRYPGQRKGLLTAPPTHMPAFDITDPATHNYISELTEEVHLYGSKILIECWPTNFLPRQFDPNETHTTRLAQGSWPGPEVTEEVLQAAEDRYLDRVQAYVNCGFDGVTARIDRLLVPWESDGSVEKGLSVAYRTDFTLRCFRRLKEIFGKGFIIEGVMSGQQPYGYLGRSATGYTLEEFIEFCHLADGIIDIMQVRNQDIIAVHPTGFTFKKGEHENLRYCKAMKDAGVSILAMPIGGFQDPEEMDRLIAEGQCDMIGMARAFMADYAFLQKIEEGRGEDIRPCIWCNSCHGTTTDKNGPWVNRCTVNPELGFEARMDRLVREPGESKKVAIVGGGVAGLQAAITAVERGHRVTLFEAKAYLGGQLIHADSFSFKWPLRDYKNWLIRRVTQLGVDVHLNTTATPELILDGGFDAVLAATGAKAVFPESIQGLRNSDGSVKPEYRTCHDVFGKESELGKEVIIVGGSETGVETAMYLAENGHKVTVLTRQSSIGHDCSKAHYITAAWMDPSRGDDRADQAPAWTRYPNLHSISGATTTRVEGNTLYYSDQSGTEYTLVADNIVICGGMKPLQDEALSFYGSADKFYIIGDANGIGNVQKCVREGWSRSNMI